MRIIAGKAGRTRLEVPRGVTRPTADRVREALFSIIGERVAGAKVLDLYAGSGALGLEALSRGAAAAVFVDDSAEACKTIERNLGRAHLDGEDCAVRRMSVEMFLLKRGGGAGPYGLIFADPPYRKVDLGSLLESEALRGALEEGGWLVLETAAEEDVLVPPGWKLVDERRYGGTKVTILTTKT